MVLTIEFMPSYEIGRQEVHVELQSLLTIAMLFDEKKYPYSVYLRGSSVNPSEFGWSDRSFLFWCMGKENIFNKMKLMNNENDETRNSLPNSHDNEYEHYLTKAIQHGVHINHNNELDIDKWVWSVEVHDTDYWLASFDTYGEAYGFCSDNGLLIIYSTDDKAIL